MLFYHIFLVKINLCNFSDDDYDSYDCPSSRQTNQLDDKDWQVGNRSIAEEAIDKVKEFVSNIKIFDAPETY